MPRPAAGPAPEPSPVAKVERAAPAVAVAPVAPASPAPRDKSSEPLDAAGQRSPVAPPKAAAFLLSLIHI
eukprot:8926948-Alexandrium_andersonii.AAC.1